MDKNDQVKQIDNLVSGSSIQEKPFPELKLSHKKSNSVQPEPKSK